MHREVPAGFTEAVAGLIPVSYRVLYERDETGAWIAHAVDIRGCHTYGSTIAQARSRIREALSLFVDDADSALLVEEIHLPAAARAAVRRSERARTRLETSRAEAGEATAQAARTLVEELHLGLRDAGELLGLSHQRIQQIIRG